MNNRAVSEVLASLLLVAIAVGAAIIVYVFSIGLVGALQTSGGQEIMSFMNVTSTTATTSTSTSSFSASVGIDYLGPYPLNPSLSGTAGILTTSFKIGNPPNTYQPEIYEVTITTTAGFASYFTLTVSTSSFTLQSGTRQNIVVYANYKPGTVPAGQYTASIYVVGSALSYPTGSSPGHTGYTCPIVITVQAPGL